MKVSLTPVLVGLALWFIPTAVLSDDCSFSQSNVAAYEENCSALDGCANLERMRELVAADCGTAVGPAVEVEPVEREPAPAPKPTPVSPRDVPLNTVEVAKLQKHLTSLGFDLGKADGRVGPATRKAIVLFQQARGLPATGAIDEATLAAIIAASDELGAERSATSVCAFVDELKSVDFEREWRGAIARIDAFRELRQDIRQLKSELNSDLFYQAGQWRQASQALLDTAYATGHLIENLVRVNPVTGAAVGAVSVATHWSKEMVIVGWKRWKNAKAFVTADIEKLKNDILLEVGAKRHPILQATKTVYDLAKDLNDLATHSAEFERIRGEANDAIANLDRQLGDLETQLRDLEEWKRMREEMLSAGTAACAEEQRGNLPSLP